MTDEHDNELDRAIRRAARESTGAFRRSVAPDEVESSLRGAHDLLGANPVQRGRRRRVVAAAAAAAVVVALVGALIITAIRSGCAQLSIPNTYTHIIIGGIIIVAVIVDQLRHGSPEWFFRMLPAKTNE